MPEPATKRAPIPWQDLQFQYVRAAGPGGQNVNKVATAVQLRFDLRGTRVLSEPTKARLRQLAGKRLTADGAVLIAARSHRTQAANQRDALERLQQLIEQALVAPRPRVPTRPTAAAQRRRLDSKRQHRTLKRLRARIEPE